MKGIELARNKVAPAPTLMQETNASIISTKNAVSNDTQVTMRSELDL